MQTQGSLRDGGLATLLQSMQAERATGTLTIDNGGDSCSLYFLFGHLFHASGPGGQGEEVVIDALGWDEGSFQFDPRAKLPAEETIKASPAELIAASESRHAPAAAGATGASSWPDAAPAYAASDAYAAPASSLPAPIEEPAYAMSRRRHPRTRTRTPTRPLHPNTSPSRPRWPSTSRRTSRPPNRCPTPLRRRAPRCRRRRPPRRRSAPSGLRRARSRPVCSRCACTRYPRAAPTTKG